MKFAVQFSYLYLSKSIKVVEELESNIQRLERLRKFWNELGRSAGKAESKYGPFPIHRYARVIDDVCHEIIPEGWVLVQSF